MPRKLAQRESSSETSRAPSPSRTSCVMRNGLHAAGPCTARAEDVGPSVCAGSKGRPSCGVSTRACFASARASNVSAGSSHACSARSNVPPCTGSRAPPPSASNARRAFSGPGWMALHAGRVRGSRPPSSPPAWRGACLAACDVHTHGRLGHASNSGAGPAAPDARPFACAPCFPTFPSLFDTRLRTEIQ